MSTIIGAALFHFCTHELPIFCVACYAIYRRKQNDRMVQ